VNTRRITLIVAVVLAIGTGILTLRYLTSIQQTANVQQQQVELKKILIASRDIPARAKITPDMLTSVNRPASQVEPGAMDDPKQAQGDIALITIPSGSTITETRVGRPAEVGLTVSLKPGMRAISIPVDRVKAVSGLLQPGDRVDVLAGVARGGDSPPKTVTIIRGALVLALNDSTESAGATPSPDAGNLTTVTLGVTPKQADLLTLADMNTTLRLALRSPQEPVRSLEPEELILPETSAAAAPEPAGNNVPPPVQPAAVPAVVAPTVSHAVPVNPVTVIDGDHVVSAGQQ
jgi:pilus assembly protein CpaB